MLCSVQPCNPCLARLFHSPVAQPREQANGSRYYQPFLKKGRNPHWSYQSQMQLQYAHNPLPLYKSPIHIYTRKLTHWGWATHICISNLIIIGSDNGLSPGQRQAIIWSSAGILLIGPLGLNFSEILIEIQTFSFKKKHLKVLSAKCRDCVSASMS